MSRSLLALPVSLLALMLLALPSAAQVPSAGGSLAIEGLPQAHQSNQTQAAIPFTVQIRLNQGTCIGGSGQFQVNLAATRSGSNASVEIQPASLMFQVPETQTLSMPYTGRGSAVLLVKPGLVRENVTVPVTVRATADVACSAPGAGMGASGLSAQDRSNVTFMPVSEEVRNGPVEAMPGLEIPALLAAVWLALLRRR